MKPVSMEDSLAQIVIDRPESARVLERWNLDYCCKGKRSLRQACGELALDPEGVIRSLAEATPHPAQVDCAGLTTMELIDHIESTHHVFVREELPRLTNLFAKVTAVHRLNHPELVPAQSAFDALRAELEPHLLKEERILFPFVRALENEAEGGEAANFHCGSIANPIRAMEHEHENAGALMAELHELLNGYTHPADACASYRALLDGVAAFESDLHDHVHKENYLLFPRALRLESV